jgi:hypothetical protein
MVAALMARLHSHQSIREKALLDTKFCSNKDLTQSPREFRIGFSSPFHGFVESTNAVEIVTART